MTTTRFEVIAGGGGNRRRWTREEKERLVAASFEPGVTVSQVARSAGLHTSQLFRWRKQLCDRSVPTSAVLIPVAVAEPEPASKPLDGFMTRKRIGRRRACDRIEIELGHGRVVRIDADIDTEALARILDVVERRR